MNSQIPIKFAQGCIAVKENYLQKQEWGNSATIVEARFCVDMNYNPCRICTFKSNNLVPLAQIRDTDIETFIRSKKAMYSRLDCVAFIVDVHVEFSKNASGEVYISSYKANIFRPFSVNGESLAVATIDANVGTEGYERMKQNIVSAAANMLLSKQNFISARL